MDHIVAELLYKRSLDRKLSRLKKGPRKRVIRKAARKSMKPLHKAIVAAAPKGSYKEGGTLKRNLKLRAMKRSRVRIGVMVVVGKDTWKSSKGKKWDVFYANMVELGTKFQRAQNFMKDTSRRMRRSVLKHFEKQIVIEIRDLVK